MLNKNLALIALVVFAAGCGLETRTYVITKDRVGLDQGNGNGGCVMGKCPPPPAPAETTRKVYVLEITKPVPESQVRKIEETAVNAIVDTSASPDAAAVESAPAASGNPQSAVSSQAVVPVVGELPGTATTAEPSTPPAVQNAGSVQAGTYTVQKDDTLQKISKKVFGTYSKWYKIYQANKDKIKNPNFVKPGTVLTIPSIK
jgi:nucleoid-associated protein YgaU